MKRHTHYIKGVLLEREREREGRGRERERRTRKDQKYIFHKITAENIPNLMKHINLQI
jgi:hypothetical protein